MKYKVLLIGSNSSAIEDFFHQTIEQFELLSSSMRFEDVMGHLKYYKPDVLIYCLNCESSEHMKQAIAIKQKLLKHDIPLVILGNQVDCSEFSQIAFDIADLTLVKPITANAIQERIVAFFREKEERIRKEMEELEKLKQDQRVRKHVLIIDDDPAMGKVIKQHLEGEYDTAIAVNGALALRFLKSKQTDLILLDYEMPGMDGPEVLERIRKNDWSKDIPVLFLTGASEKEKIAKALSMKPEGYLLKPINGSTLLAKVQEFIG